jgi:hypothetical protein
MHPGPEPGPAAAVDLGLLLRREVGRLRQRESRRVFDSAVNIGELDGPRDSFVVRTADLPVLDAALRTDLVARLLDDTPATHGTVWLTRAGQPFPHDEDLAWLAATCRAFGSAGRVLTGFYAITRVGWLDVRTGENRTWKRLRL